MIFPCTKCSMIFTTMLVRLTGLEFLESPDYAIMNIRRENEAWERDEMEGLSLVVLTFPNGRSDTMRHDITTPQCHQVQYGAGTACD